MSLRHDGRTLVLWISTDWNHPGREDPLRSRSLMQTWGSAVRIIQELRPIRVLPPPPLPPQPVGLALVSGGPDGALAFKPSFYTSCYGDAQILASAHGSLYSPLSLPLLHSVLHFSPSGWIKRKQDAPTKCSTSTPLIPGLSPRCLLAISCMWCLTCARSSGGDNGRVVTRRQEINSSQPTEEV